MKNIFSGVTRSFTVFTVVLAMATAMWAQERTGTVVGSVKDGTGAGIPGAEVEMSSPALIRATKVVSDEQGEFLLGGLPPGVYTLLVKKAGFASIKQEGLAVQIGRQLRTDLKMEVGQVTESVTVSGEAVLIDTTQSAPQTNISEEAYDKLPKGRSFSSLLAMAPGVRFEPKQGTGGAGGFSVDGASGSENVYNIEGIDNTTLLDGKLPRNSEIPIEFVSETQIKSGADAQYGGAVGGVVNVSVKGGSNKFHGDIGFYGINTAMVGERRDILRVDPATQRKAEYFNRPKDDYRMVNPVFRIGGPIAKDKLWFSLGSSPIFEKYQRPVTFLSGQSATYTREDRADYTYGKLDYAPLAKLRLSSTYFYLPVRQRGTLPSIQGTDNVNTPWSQYGQRLPGTSWVVSGTYTINATSTFYAQTGQNYRNSQLYGRPTGTYYTTTATGAATRTDGGPLGVTYSAVDLTPNSRTTLQDIQKRQYTEVMYSKLFNAGGQHNVKVGYTRNGLSNNSTGDGYPNDWVRFYWGQTYGSVIAFPGQRVRGTYGYFRYRVFKLGTGNVGSNNQGIYVNDNWRVTKRLTLNLGLRTEREYIPSFSSNTSLPSKAITFGFGKKLAPRLGFAYDVKGDGKLKVFGNFGLFYDLFKYELPRGSFGGDFWVDYYYRAETNDIFSVKPGAGCPRTCAGGTFIEARDNRIPSNDPSEGLLDPNLKPMRQRNFDFGAEWSITNKTVFSTRYSKRSLLTGIEDVGLLTPQGEQYFITNPGFGLSIDPKRLNGYPATPKAKREYDAIEFRVARRFDKWLLDASYTYSALRGNYSGLASSDENGRNSPNVNRYFDLPWNALTEKGKVADGRLATDRPSTFKLFTSYSMKSKIGTTNFAPIFLAYQGTPLTTELGVDGLPTYPYGRGDLGRTPMFRQMDLLISQDFTPFKNETMKLRFEFNARNLFDQKRTIDKFVTLNHILDGDVSVDDPKDLFKGFSAQKLLATGDFGRDPRYGLNSAFQAPREIRLGVRFIF